jgi:predicted DNA-binding protein
MPTLTKLEQEANKEIKPKNKGGRPKGSKNKATILKEVIENNVQAHFAEFAEEAAGHLMRGVREGDSTCTKIYWDRVMPSQKATDGASVSAPLINITVTGMESVPSAIVIENEPED